MHLNEIKWQKLSGSCCQMHRIFSSSEALETSVFGLYFLSIYLTKPWWIHLPRFLNALLFWWLIQAPLCLYSNWGLCHGVSVENALCPTVSVKAKRFPLSSQNYLEPGVQIAGRRGENPFRHKPPEEHVVFQQEQLEKEFFLRKTYLFDTSHVFPGAKSGCHAFPRQGNWQEAELLEIALLS